ncbi:hypothetical protein CMI47_19615 [Candidatus Pacearchaeota archaeon]|nr:hypothetical protein [Candidatus Pacearchaeota archaeon]|tara:strand:- start:6915 stop:7325 length:411 start_codon:yes stop_codon:yes gene_type:complete
MIASIFLYAAIGITVEIVFNAFRIYFSKNDRDLSLKGSASIWMLPIYGFGLTYGLDFIFYTMSLISGGSLLRWVSYPFWVWAAELIIGLPTKRKLWDYSDIKYNWKGVISFQHYPAWMLFGIAIETLRPYTDGILL